MPLIVNGNLTILSAKQAPQPKKEPVSQPTVTTTDDNNEYLNKINSAKHSFFNTTIEGEKPNWTKSDYLVDILSE